MILLQAAVDRKDTNSSLGGMRARLCAAPLAGAVDHRNVRITYDPEVDAAYIHLTDEQLPPGRDSVPVDPPEGMQAYIVLDWKDGKMVGLEVLDAASLLHSDLLAQAIRPDES